MVHQEQEEKMEILDLEWVNTIGQIFLIDCIQNLTLMF